MPMYFFDIVDGVPHRDSRGMELRNDWCADQHARETARAMVKRRLCGPDPSKWEVVARKETGQEVARVKFSEVDGTNS